ncbi:MAG: flippase-like domain-containing protein [Bacteriovoracaceae bacterium]|jgi:uncharacterized membrane protein YbhN (UPF0104 family)|nr:flippase-like domain-containing protein [Bacteriovoracaceae bacterium]
MFNSRKLPIFLKLAFGLALIYWLFQKGGLSYQNVKIGLLNGKLAVVFIILALVRLGLASFRTKDLLQIEGASNKGIGEILIISWASIFISCIAPISIFGELFKIKKLMNFKENLCRDNTIYAAIFSKLYSIITLLTIVLIAAFFTPELIPISRSNYTILVGSLLALYVVFLFKNYFVSFLGFNKNDDYQGFFQRRWGNFHRYILKMLEDKFLIWRSLFFSIGIQVSNIVSIMLIIKLINPSVEVGILELACVVSIGIFSMLVPISFYGLGVGHLAFASLLALINIENGADVFTIFFALSFIFNFIGVIPFLILNRRSA